MSISSTTVFKQAGNYYYCGASPFTLGGTVYPLTLLSIPCTQGVKDIKASKQALIVLCYDNNSFFVVGKSTLGNMFTANYTGWVTVSNTVSYNSVVISTDSASNTGVVLS